MTKHPLTDEKAAELIAPEHIQKAGRWRHWMSQYGEVPIEDAMRLAADWQLEQVKLTGQCLINELHENNSHIVASHAAAFLEVLTKAMRSSQEE